MNKEMEDKIRKEKIMVDIKGLKCDNPKCDYMDYEIPFEDYPNWINVPCPKCGSNLLTQEDYDISVSIIKAAELLKRCSGPIDPNAPLAKMKVHLNGSGQVDFEICPLDEK